MFGAFEKAMKDSSVQLKGNLLLLAYKRDVYYYRQVLKYDYLQFKYNTINVVPDRGIH